MDKTTSIQRALCSLARHRCCNSRRCRCSNSSHRRAHRTAPHPVTQHLGNHGESSRTTSYRTAWNARLQSPEFVVPCFFPPTRSWEIVGARLDILFPNTFLVRSCVFLGVFGLCVAVLPGGEVVRRCEALHSEWASSLVDVRVALVFVMRCRLWSSA